MAIAFSCEQCRKRYEVDAALAGRRVKCKGCGASMTVPGPGTARGAPNAAPPLIVEDDADPYGFDEDAPRPGPRTEEVLLPRGAGGRRPVAGDVPAGVPVWPWLAGGAVGLVLLALLLTLLIGRRPANPAVAEGADLADAPAAPAGQDAPAAAGPSRPVTPSAGFQRDNASAAAVKVSWRVKADPPAWKPEFPEVVKLSIPVPEAYGGVDVLYPTTPSPFVVLGGNEVDAHYREVWDLRTGTKVGRLSGKIEVAKPIALSPDGAYLAVHTNPVPRTTDIWRIRDAQRLGRIQDGDQIPDVIEFAGPGEGRLVIGTSYAKSFQVWDFLAGAKLLAFQTPSGFDRDSVALSPGRRYMALTLAHKNRLQVYDLTTGRLAGEYELTKDGSSDLDCEGMAFSPDGAALAGLFTAGQATHLLSWDATTGALASDFRVEGPNPYGKSYSYEGEVVQWLPDQSGWLIYDQSFVERRSGQAVWSIAFNPIKPQEHGPRKVLDGGRMVAVARVRDRKVIQVVPLPGDKIRTAMALAKGGGNAVDATLPAVKTAGRGAARKVAAVAGPVGWTPFSERPAASKAAANRPIKLKVSALDVLTLLVSGPEAPQAIVVSSPGGRLAAGKARQSQQPRQVDRYDLAGGRPLGRFEVPSVSSPIAVSAGGTHVLLAHAGGLDRLDVHATANGEPVAGWRPYDQESGDDRNVLWADFLDPKRVLTVNPAGTLVLWSVPDCQAVYVAEQAMEGAPVLSPGRKSLAVLRGGALRLLDPATGRPQGDAAAAGHRGGLGLAAAGFAPDGRELAAVLDGTIVRWDLQTGQVVDEIPCPEAKVGSLQYGEGRHVLLDGKTLFDLARKRTVWHYEGGVHAPRETGAVHHYASGPISGPATLNAVEVPEKKVTRAEAAAVDPKTKAMLREGATVSLQVVGSPPRDAETFRRELLEGLTARLQAVGATVAADKPVRLVASFREKDTGQTIELRKLGGGANNAETRSFQARNLEWTLSVADDQGGPVVFAADTVGVRGFGLEQLPAGENDWEGYLRTRQWHAAAAQAVGRDLPFFVARRPDGSAVLPGWTSLGYPTQ